MIFGPVITDEQHPRQLLHSTASNTGSSEETAAI
jgi:hypothetical protein